ncbi:MAG TPA: SulP family inorganic anion transporter [Myxococcota bacterium]|nr:SulP family inorganic anion transporter [Myxococcota bacterium]
MAALSLASMNVPQVLGYTRIAGTPLVTGLYTALFPVLAFALLGSSRHLVVAADSATAALLFGSLSHIAEPETPRYMALVEIVALWTAGLLLVARIFRLGFLADFLSRTVLVGFLTGVGFQVAIAMLGGMSGIAFRSSRTVAQLAELLPALPRLQAPTPALSAFVAASILLGRRLVPRFPVALLVVAGTIFASAVFDLGARGIAVVGPVPGGLPSFVLPSATWHDCFAVLPVAASCFVIIIAQSAATSRAFAARHQERVDEDADILGLSVANAAAALSGAFVVNGSPTQTAMAERAGARSQLAQIFFAGIVLVVLLLLTGVLEHLPRCVLASIVFTIAVGMIDLSALRSIRRESPGEFRLAMFTAAAVIGMGVEVGVLLAIGLSLLRHVRHSYRPHTSIVVWDDAGRANPLAVAPGSVSEPGLIVYRFGADLFYANEARFVDELRALVEHAPEPVRWVVVDASAITNIDYSAAGSVRELIADLSQRGVGLVFGRVSPGLRADLERHRVVEALGEHCVFATLHEAVARARGEGASHPPARLTV